MSSCASNSNYQNNLLQAIFNGQHKESFDARGLDIYRRNLLAAAKNALSTSFPTLSSLIGTPAMAVLAREYLSAHGRSVFDWTLWGASFPLWLENHLLSCRHPYLADCARLDWGILLAGRAADARLNYASFSALAKRENFHFSLEFSPGAKVIRSSYPIVAIYQAHRQNNIAPDLRQARMLLHNDQGQIALVWRQGLYTQVREVSGEETPWLRLLESKETMIADVLCNSSSTTMPLEDWLDRAIKEQLVTGLRCSTPPK